MAAKGHKRERHRPRHHTVLETVTHMRPFALHMLHFLRCWMHTPAAPAWQLEHREIWRSNGSAEASLATGAAPGHLPLRLSRRPTPDDV